jgi:hypothetical protein
MIPVSGSSRRLHLFNADKRLMRSAVDRVSNMEGRLDAECEAYVDGLSAHVTFQLGHSPPGTRAAVSDISFHFPLWFALALLAIEFWHVPFAVAVLLVSVREHIGSLESLMF